MSQQIGFQMVGRKIHRFLWVQTVLLFVCSVMMAGWMHHMFVGVSFLWGGITYLIAYSLFSHLFFSNRETPRDAFQQMCLAMVVKFIAIAVLWVIGAWLFSFVQSYCLSGLLFSLVINSMMMIALYKRELVRT